MCHVRIQSGPPFTVHVCVNGREWLCRELQRHGIGLTRSDNCLTAVPYRGGGCALPRLYARRGRSELRDAHGSRHTDFRSNTLRRAELSENGWTPEGFGRNTAGQEYVSR